MSVPNSHARIKAQVWQAIAQSELDLSPLPLATREQLVELVTNAALVEMDGVLGEAVKAADEPESAKSDLPGTDMDMDPDPLKEDMLWEGRPFLSITTRYLITDERVRIIEGLLGKRRDDMELIRVQDISQSQTLSERLLNLGDITIRSHDPSNPIIVLRNVQEPERVHEIVRRAVLNARQRHNFSYREEM